MTCTDSSLACDSTNLVLRAAKVLMNHPSSSSRQQGVHIHLHKQIPSGAGLGGGSSNAATTLVGLNRLWGLNLSTSELAKLAGHLGSDVPFFLFGPSSLCTGRGQIVVPIAPPTPLWAMLVLPEWSLATPKVYHTFDRMDLGTSQALAELPWEQWSQLSADRLLPHLVNDLEPAAFAVCPALGNLRDQLEQHLHRPIRMSGSGSSLFTLFDTLEQAEAASTIVRNHFKIRVLTVRLAVESHSFEDPAC